MTFNFEHIYIVLMSAREEPSLRLWLWRCQRAPWQHWPCCLSSPLRNASLSLSLSKSQQPKWSEINTFNLGLSFNMEFLNACTCIYTLWKCWRARGPRLEDYYSILAITALLDKTTLEAEATVTATCLACSRTCVEMAPRPNPTRLYASIISALILECKQWKKSRAEGMQMVT